MSQENVEIVHRVYDVLNRRDWEGVFRDAHPDFEMTTQRGPTAGTRRGQEVVQGFVEEYMGSFENLIWEPEQFFDGGNQIVVFACPTHRRRVGVVPHPPKHRQRPLDALLSPLGFGVAAAMAGGVDARVVVGPAGAAVRNRDQVVDLVGAGLVAEVARPHVPLEHPAPHGLPSPTGDPHPPPPPARLPRPRAVLGAVAVQRRLAADRACAEDCHRPRSLAIVGPSRRRIGCGFRSTSTQGRI